MSSETRKSFRPWLLAAAVLALAFFSWALFAAEAEHSSLNILQRQLHLLKTQQLFGKGRHVARRYDLLKAQGAKAFEQKRFESAAIIYYTIVENPEFEDIIDRDEMEYLLISSLYHNGEDYAALVYIRNTLARGPKSPHFVEVFRVMVDILNRVRDWNEIEPALQALQQHSKSLPGVIREEANYLFARMAYFQNDLPQAQTIFSTISSSSRFHSRALYHLGVIAAKQGDMPLALKRFKSAYSASKDNTDFRISEMDGGRQAVDAQRNQFQDLCRLAIARVEYTMHTEADFSGIAPASPVFPVALYESGWANFSQKRYDQTLRISESYFIRFPEHELAPEAILLNANAHMESGHLVTASKEFKRFIDRYEPILPMLKFIYQNPDAMQAFRDFQTQKDMTARPELAAWVYQEPNLKNIRKYLNSITAEEQGVVKTREGWSSVAQYVGEGDRKVMFPSRSNIRPHGEAAEKSASVSKKAGELRDLDRVEQELKTSIASVDDTMKKRQAAKLPKSSVDQRLVAERERLVGLQQNVKGVRQRVLSESDKTLTRKPGEAYVSGARDFQKLVNEESEMLPGIEAGLQEKRKALTTLSAKIVQQHIKLLTAELQQLVKKAYLGEIEIAFIEREKTPDNLSGALQAARTRLVTLINNFLVKYPGAPEVPDQLFRLAELSYDHAKQRYFTAQEEYDGLYEKFLKGGLAAAPKEPHADYSESIQICRRILTQFPKYKSKDKVLYVLGYYYDEQGSKRESIATFKQLVEEFPKSDFAIESHMRLAENYFDLRELKQAIAAYQVVLQYPDSLFYELAIYKIAWSYYRMQDYPDAIQHFSKLVGLEKAPSGDLKGTGLEDEFKRRLEDLHKEALTYLALSFSEYGGPNAVIANFKQNGMTKYTVKVLGLLSDIYYQQLRYPETIEATRAYLTYSPYEPDGPSYQERIVESYDKMGDTAASFQERQRMADLFGPRSEWAQKNRKNTKAIAEGEKLVKAALIYSATLHHEKAQKASANLGDKAKGGALPAEALKSYKLAIEAYKRFLWDFPKSPEAYEMRFNYAECLYTIGDYETAGYQYEYVAMMNLKDGKYLKDAAFSAVLSYQDLLKASGINFETEAEKMKEVVIPKEVKDPARIAFKPKVLGRTQKQLVNAYDNYVNWLPKDSKVPDIMFKAALLHYQAENYPEAIDRFVKFDKRFPQHRLAPSAMNYVLVANTTTQNWDEVEKWARKISKDPNLQGKFAQADLNKLLGVAILYQAELLKNKGDLKDASAKYLTIQDELKDNPLAARGMYNAAAIFQKEGKSTQAIETLEGLVARYPQSELAPQALLQVGKAYETNLQLDKAALAFERLARSYPKSPDAADSLYNSALFLEQLGQDRRAGENYLAYATTFPQKSDAEEVHYRSARAFERNGDREKALTLYQEQVDKYNPSIDRRIECHMRAGELYATSKNASQAEEQYEKAYQAYKKHRKSVGDAGRYYAGKAQFMRAEASFNRFTAVHLQGSPKAMKRTLETKAERLEQANRMYLEAVEVGYPEWATASMYKIGRGYQAFSEALFDAPKPPGMNAKQKQAYDDDLKEQAFPIEDKAIEAYEKALKNAHRVKDYSFWTQQVRNQLQAYKPREYPPLYEFLPQIQTVGAEAQGGYLELN